MVSKYYQEFNPNPLKKEVGDCQIRALCAVTGKSWYEIYDMLVAYGRKTCCPFFWLDLNSSYHVELFNMIRHKVQREKGKKALNVETFCKEHPTGKYILRMAKHSMGIIDGKYYELYPGWEKKTIYTYYEYKDI